MESFSLRFRLHTAKRTRPIEFECQSHQTFLHFLSLSFLHIYYNIFFKKNQKRFFSPFTVPESNTESPPLKGGALPLKMVCETTQGLPLS